MKWKDNRISQWMYKKYNVIIRLYRYKTNII